VLAASACGGDDDGERTTSEVAISGTVQIDGSSTVGPFARQVATLFESDHPGARITVSVSNTGGGFEHFCAGERDISNASRPITRKEKQACRAEGVDYLVFPVANDAVTLITSKRNAWADCLTTLQLKRIWEPGSRIERWNQIDPRFPNEQLRLFGPDADSGTFDFFTETINGKRSASRSDYRGSKVDEVTVRGVARSDGGLGYLGFNHYTANKDVLNAIAVDSGGGCVTPSVETVQDGTYKPLSRPLYVYVNKASAQRPAVAEFLHFMLTGVETPLVAITAKLIPLTERQRVRAVRALDRADA